MDKNNVAVNKEEQQEIVLINEGVLRSKIYMVRGQKVMLDFELAEIYGYTTTKFNQQVKNNIEKFEEERKIIENTDGAITIGQYAKLISSKVDMGRNRL